MNYLFARSYGSARSTAGPVEGYSQGEATMLRLLPPSCSAVGSWLVSPFSPNGCDAVLAGIWALQFGHGLLHGRIHWARVRRPLRLRRADEARGIVAYTGDSYGSLCRHGGCSSTAQRSPISARSIGQGRPTVPRLRSAGTGPSTTELRQRSTGVDSKGIMAVRLGWHIADGKFMRWQDDHVSVISVRDRVSGQQRSLLRKTDAIAGRSASPEEAQEAINFWSSK